MILKGVKQAFVDYYFLKVEELQKKYGKCKKPYFDNNWQKTEEKNAKGYKGLHRHHIDEFVWPGLCYKSKSQSYGLQLQAADCLVWCNQKEHILLHWIIAAAHNYEKRFTGAKLLMDGNSGYRNYNEYWCNCVEFQMDNGVFKDADEIIQCIETFWPK